LLLRIKAINTSESLKWYELINQTAQASSSSGGPFTTTPSESDRMKAKPLKDTPISPNQSSGFDPSSFVSVYEGYVFKKADDSKVRLNNPWKQVNHKILFEY
jgi:hypothetical protein